ncbi:hypothetical protein ACTXT7_016010 [Hymenolepis weldensis]
MQKTTVDGFGLINCAVWPREPVFLEKLEVNAKIVNNIADESLKFCYANDTSKVLETEFIYQLDPEAAVYHLDVVIENKHMEAVCRERLGSGGKIKMSVPSDPNMFVMLKKLPLGEVFKMNIGDVPVGGRVILTFKYVVPLIVKDVNNSLSRFKLQTSSNSVVSLLSVPRTISSSTKSVAKLSFAAEIYSSEEILSVITENHALRVDFLDATKKHVKVSLPYDIEFIHDFELEFVSQKLHQLASVCEIGNVGNNGFINNHCIMASFLPSIPQLQITRGRKCEITFIVDCSGNYDDEIFKELRDALLLSIKSLPKQSRFQIISYGAKYHALFPNPVEYSKLNLAKSLHFLTQLRTEGDGSGLFAALNLTYKTPVTEKGQFRQIILLTDGDISNPAEVIEMITENQMDTRLSVACTRDLLENPALWAVANAGRGLLKIIRENESLLSAAVSALRTALEPPLRDVSLNWDVRVNNKVEVLTTPLLLPPLFSGLQMTAFGIISPSAEETNDPGKVKGTVTLQYRLDDTIQSYTSKIQSSPIVHGNFPLHRFAAKALIADLDKKLANTSPLRVWKKRDICQKIIDISVNTNVISPFTSFVGVEPSRIDNTTKPPPVRIRNKL